jgi:hypothetical protein
MGTNDWILLLRLKNYSLFVGELDIFSLLKIVIFEEGELFL